MGVWDCSFPDSLQHETPAHGFPETFICSCSPLIVSWCGGSLHGAQRQMIRRHTIAPHCPTCPPMVPGSVVVGWHCAHIWLA